MLSFGLDSSSTSYRLSDAEGERHSDPQPSHLSNGHIPRAGSSGRPGKHTPRARKLELPSHLGGTGPPPARSTCGCGCGGRPPRQAPDHYPWPWGCPLCASLSITLTGRTVRGHNPQVNSTHGAHRLAKGGDTPGWSGFWGVGGRGRVGAVGGWVGFREALPRVCEWRSPSIKSSRWTAPGTPWLWPRGLVISCSFVLCICAYTVLSGRFLRAEGGGGLRFLPGRPPQCPPLGPGPAPVRARHTPGSP